MITQTKATEVTKRVVAARTKLVLDEPFFGVLALKLKLVEEADCGCPDLKQCPHTAWTDGVHLGYFPRFVQSLSQTELLALICHEVMHCASGHPWRRDLRDPRDWNEACDRAINPNLRDAGFKLPADGLFELEPSHKGKSAEWIYDRLPRDQQQQNQQQQKSGSGSGQQQSGSGGGGGGKPQSSQQPSDARQNQGQNQPAKSRAADQSKSSAPGPRTGQDANGPQEPHNTAQKERSGPEGANAGKGGNAPDHKNDAQKRERHKCDSLGEVRDAPSQGANDGEEMPTEAEWQQAVQQAATLAKGQGRLPGSMKRFAKVAGESRTDWRSVTRRFAQEVARSDYTFARPNARYIAHGSYVPSLRNHEVGMFAIGIDTSNSIDQVLLAQFAAELKAIVEEVKPRQVRVLYCDTEVEREEVFEPGDEIALKAEGGGGTDFRPVFDRIAEWDEQPVAIIYLTDLMGVFPTEAPVVETLWVTGEKRAREVPFGEVVAATY